MNNTSYVQVWTVKPDEIKCIDVHDVKEPVYELTVNAKLACYVSQGSGVKASLICCLNISNTNVVPSQDKINKI